MAEVVERNVEESLNELSYIKKAKLFSKSEINELIRRRRRHEYALQKRNKRVLDYEAYISTELAILKLLRHRRHKAQDSRFVDKIERSIVSRLVRLHRQLCYRFQSRVDVWIRFIEFFKILGRHLSAVRVWNRLLQVHGRTDPRLWASCASYQLHEHAKFKVRSSLRNLSTETTQLVAHRKKLRSELKALTTYVDKKEQHKVAGIVDELRRTSAKLGAASEELTRERRIAWDRIYLHAIREARRLLTEGISLNPDCHLLHLELLKLEACAVEFFRSRVSSRNPVVQADIINDETTTASSGEKKKKKKINRYADDDAVFMSEVLEDVSYITSAKGFNLVLESLLDQFPKHLQLLQQAHEVTSAFPHFVDSPLQIRLNDYIEKLTMDSEAIAIMSVEQVITPDQSARVAANLRISKLSETVLNQGLQAGLKLWDDWFTETKQNGSKTDTFRYLDPRWSESIGLLTTRLLLHSLHSGWDLISLGSGEKKSYHKLLENEEFEAKTRIWLDTLSTSPWGHRSPEFWFRYIEFEKSCGDCTRVPSIQWRASKTLDADSYLRFTALLNEDWDLTC